MSMWRTGKLVDAATGDIVAYCIDMQEGRYWADCAMCGNYRRLDHAVAWYCGPTHDEIGSLSTEYLSTDDAPAVVGGMCVCRSCHDSWYASRDLVEK